MRVIVIGLLGALFFATGCDHEERIARLEKQSKEMQSDRDRVAVYDLQAKCSKDSQKWFKENWPSDKDTALLTFVNHYNKKANQCFVFVEYHYNSKLAGPDGTSWSNSMSLWNLYENDKFGDFSENHYTYFKPKLSTTDEVIMCEVSGNKCKSMTEFNNLVAPYMND